MSNPAIVQLVPRNLAEGSTSIGVLPAAGSPLPLPAKGILVQTDGNMGVVMADGTDNDDDLVAVTAGQFFWGLGAVSGSSSNTAVLLYLS